MPIRIDFLSNVRDLLRGVDDTERAFDDVADSLDDVVRDGDRATDRLERSFKDVADASRDAGRDIGRNMDDGFDRAKRRADEFKDEAKQSGKEAAASFSGEFDDVTDYVQEVVAQGLGPAGIAGAAIIGAIGAAATAAVEEWNEKIEGIRDATAEMWAAAAAEGQTFIETEAIRAEAHRILWDKAYEENLRAAEEAGVSRVDFAVAAAQGEGDVFDRVHKQILDAREAEKQAAIDSMNAGVDGNVAIQDAVTSVNSELARTVTILDEKAKATEENKQKAREAAAVTKQLEEEERAQIQRTRDADQKRYEAMAERYSKPIKAKIEVEVDDSAAWAGLDALRRRAQQGITVNVRPGQGRFWE